jgi:hypothetical protein
MTLVPWRHTTISLSETSFFLLSLENLCFFLQYLDQSIYICTPKLHSYNTRSGPEYLYMYTPTILDLDQSIYICTPQITQTTFFLSKIIVFCLFFLQKITWWPCFSQNLELYYTCTKCIWFNFWCFNATFSNISAISWRPVLVVEEAGGPGENHQPWASNW